MKIILELSMNSRMNTEDIRRKNERKNNFRISGRVC